MGSTFQSEKLKKRKDDISAKRERRRDPEARKMAPRGLGSRRVIHKAPIPQPTQQNQSAPTPQKPSSPPAPQKPEVMPLVRKDRLDISEEAYRRYQEQRAAM